MNNPLRLVDKDGEDVFDYVVGFGQGVKSSAWGSAKGIFELAKGLSTDPGGTASEFGEGIAYAAGHPKEVVGTVADQVSQQWKSGDVGKGQVIGSVTFAIASTLAGTKGLDKLGKLGTVSTVKGLTTPTKLFGSLNKFQASDLLSAKFGAPRNSLATQAFQKSFFNLKTGRSFNVHQQFGHKGGKPHVDIKKRYSDIDKTY